jgi:radical SAM protein with 4Fe4S-binding SPASM domain
MWRSREPATALSTDEKLALLHQFATWAPGASVVLTGGEPLHKRDEFFSLMRTCRQHALQAAVNTNATLVDEAAVDQLLTEGPRFLLVSLDSHRPELHDWVRGVPGSHERAVSTLRRLLARRREAYPGSDLRLLTNTIIFDGNIDELEAYVEFAQTLGVDGVTFQMLSRTFMLAARRDTFFERHFPRDVARVDLAIERLMALRASGAPIATPASDLHWMKLYARDPDFLGEQVCGSAERNMMVDQHGNVQLCFFMREILDGRVLGNIRQSSLSELWASALATEARGEMARCRRNCGMLNCHRKQEAS